MSCHYHITLIFLFSDPDFQALAAANLMCGYDEGMGLTVIAYVP